MESHKKIYLLQNFFVLWFCVELDGVCAKPRVSYPLVKKPPTPIYFDTVQPLVQNGGDNQKARFTFPSTNLKQNLRPTSTSPPFIPPPLDLMSPGDVMMVTISDLTHAAFSNPTSKPFVLSRPLPSDGLTSSSQSNLAISSLSKLGGYIGQHQNSTSHSNPKRSRKFVVLDSMETTNLITANDLSGNQPTTPPFQFKTTTTTTTTSPLPPPPLPSISPKSRSNRHREGKKVQSPHNYSFAPTHNPLLTQVQDEIGHDDISLFRAALTNFGSRKGTSTTMPPPTTSMQTTTSTTTTTPSTSTIAQAIRIEQGRLIQAVPEVVKVKGQSDELPYYTESGGIFEQNPQAEKESRHYVGPGNEAHERASVDFVPSVTYRPVDNFREIDSAYLKYPVHDRSSEFHERRPGPKVVVHYHHNPPSYEVNPGRVSYDQRPDSKPIRYQTTTDRNIYHDGRAPPRNHPASDYFYGDPRPPPPAPPKKAPLNSAKEADADADEEGKSGDEEDEGKSDDEEDEGKSDDEDEGKSSDDEEEGDGDEKNEEKRIENRPPPPRPPPPTVRNERPITHQFDGPTVKTENSFEFGLDDPHHTFGSGQGFNPARNQFGSEKQFELERTLRQRPQTRFEPDRNGHRTESDFIPSDNPFRTELNVDPSSPGRKRNENNRRVPQPSTSSRNLDPIYTMSIKDYDAEVKRRQNKNSRSHLPAKSRPFIPSRPDEFRTRFENTFQNFVPKSEVTQSDDDFLLPKVDRGPSHHNTENFGPKSDEKIREDFDFDKEFDLFK